MQIKGITSQVAHARGFGLKFEKFRLNFSTVLRLASASEASRNCSTRINCDQKGVYGKKLVLREGCLSGWIL